MNQLIREIPKVDPHYLAEALRNDMQEAGQHIRNVLYDLHKMDLLTGGTSYRLEQSLIALDFSHFIPVENTTEALYQEFLSLQSQIDEMSRDMEHDMNLMASIAQAALDIEDELERRGFSTEIEILLVCTDFRASTEDKRTCQDADDFCWMCDEKCTCGINKCDGSKK